MKIDFKKTRKGWRCSLEEIPVYGFGLSKIEALHTVVVALPEALQAWQKGLGYKVLENKDSLSQYHAMSNICEGFNIDDIGESYATYLTPEEDD